MQSNRGFVERRANEAKRPIWKHKKISVIDATGEFGQLRAMHLQYLSAMEIAEFAKQPSSTTFCAALTRSWVISHSTPALAHQMSQTLRAASMATLLSFEMDQLRDKSVPLKALPQSVLRDIFEQMKGAKDAVTTFADLQKRLALFWHSARPDQHPFGRMITDWSRTLMVNAAFSQTGRSVRQVQRRVKTLAGIATDAGYSDQSHMGRHVRAQTGFTPAELMRRFESDEAFWSYRLMGERY